MRISISIIGLFPGFMGIYRAVCSLENQKIDIEKLYGLVDSAWSCMVLLCLPTVLPYFD